jgi:glycosyltransferase involved in cell wall biosynthesis
LGQHPLVSVLFATFNEGAFIERSLGSLQSQETPDFDLEILVIDGASTDDTPQKVAEMARKDPRIRLLTNPHRLTPFAWNIGLRESKGQYICTLGAHNVYDRDYIAVCLRELLEQGAVGCSGRAISQPASNSLQALLCSWTLGHPFGSSPKSFRTQPEGFVDSPAFPLLAKKAILDVGGYDEEIFHNEDNDMSRKLRATGGKLYCTWKTQCYYYGKNKVGDLLKYAFRNGFWNILTVRKHLRSMSLRHFVPFVFVVGLLVLLGIGVAGLFMPALRNKAAFFLPFLGVAGAHLGLGLLASVQVIRREKSFKAAWLPPVFFAFHFAYGLGSLWAVVKHATPSDQYRYGRYGTPRPTRDDIA